MEKKDEGFLLPIVFANLKKKISILPCKIKDIVQTKNR